MYSHGSRIMQMRGDILIWNAITLDDKDFAIFVHIPSNIVLSHSSLDDFCVFSFKKVIYQHCSQKLK